MSPFVYQEVFTGVTAAFAAMMAGSRLSSSGYSLQEKGSSMLLPLLSGLVLLFWIGLRPISGAFGDTVNYAMEYSLMNPRTVTMDWSREWVWQFLMNGCKAAGFDVQVFFIIIAAGYIFSALWAVKILMPDDMLLGTVFLLCSLMFFPFAVNGLRNGLACHLVLLGICYLLKNRWVPGALVCLLAFGIHRSVILPVAAALFAIFVSRDVRLAIGIWIVSILVSLVAGGAVTSLFMGLGFDDRMTQYINLADEGGYSRTGFRLDFLLYSAAPIVMAWYVCIKQKAADNWYEVLCVIYCLCNAFWVMVIRSAFSNRFAYLSWFLYPIMIAYPLVNLEIRDDQDRFTGRVLLAYAAFSVFMWFVFW